MLISIIALLSRIIEAQLNYQCVNRNVFNNLFGKNIVDFDWKTEKWVNKNSYIKIIDINKLLFRSKN